jgi:hypothetical protein
MPWLRLMVRWRRYSAWFFLGLFSLALLGWWLLPAMLKRNAQNILQKLQAPIWYGTDGLRTVFAHWSLGSQSKEWLERKVVELSRNLARERLCGDLLHCGAALESDKFSAAPQGPLTGFRVLYGRVLRRDSKAWWQEVLLAAGARDCVGEGAAVICANCLVGKVSAVFYRHCVALLVTDARFRSIVHAFGDGRPLVYEGLSQRGFGPPIGRISCIPADMAASELAPLIIVTSSLSGTYPDGITVGTVTALRPSDDGIFQEGVVHLSPLLAGIREVALLLPEVGDLR